MRQFKPTNDYQMPRPPSCFCLNDNSGLAIERAIWRGMAIVRILLRTKQTDKARERRGRVSSVGGGNIGTGTAPPTTTNDTMEDQHKKQENSRATQSKPLCHRCLLFVVVAVVVVFSSASPLVAVGALTTAVSQAYIHVQIYDRFASSVINLLTTGQSTRARQR